MNQALQRKTSHAESMTCFLVTSYQLAERAYGHPQLAERASGISADARRAFGAGHDGSELGMQGITARLA
jgi:hypothetical protein